MEDIKINSIEKILIKAEEELNELTDNYKKNRRDILRKKNTQIKKFKEEQAQKLGYTLFNYYNTTDINVVLKELHLENKIIKK